MFAMADTGEVTTAATVLCELVSGLDLGSVDPRTAKDLVALGERIERCGRTLKTMAAAKVAASPAWQGDGDRSPEDWLARTTGSSRKDAESTVETGKRLEGLPATAEAARRGDLSAQQAEAIAGAATADPAAEARLLDAAKRKTLRELQAECRRTKAHADPDPEATAKRIHTKRSCRAWYDDDGTGHLHLSGPTATIARIDNAVRHRADCLFARARAEGRREPADAYAFDAAEQLIIRSAAAARAATDGARKVASDIDTDEVDGTPVPGGADAKIIVRVDHAALLRGRAIDGEICEIAGIGPIPVSVVREWMGDAFVAVLLTKGDDITKVVHLGRRFTATQRTALQWQDPVCARRGCTNRLRLEYDHFEDWAATHTTRLEAGKRFCNPCHRLKTTGWLVSPPDRHGECTFAEPDPAAQREALRQAAAQAVASITMRFEATGPTLFDDTG
ncbi:MAG: DUF222 domain-containing protein [Acidimicrobiia bacterium]|nr:DUF222 domain-containing protein [Acidimicrobiia bacterium]